MLNDDSLKQREEYKSKETEGQDLFPGTYQNVEANETLGISKIHRKITLLSYESLNSQNFVFVFHLQHYETQILVSESNSFNFFPSLEKEKWRIVVCSLYNIYHNV